jgi:hypothetical protein
MNRKETLVQNPSDHAKLATNRRSPFKPLPHSEIFNRRLAVYAMAAAASSVGVQAAIPTENSQSHIVFTPANIYLGGLGENELQLDLNNDGVDDITLTKFNSVYVQSTQAFFFEGGNLVAEPTGGNAAIFPPLHKGKPIGSSADFHSSKVKLAWGRDVGHSGHSGYSTGGPWAKSSPDSYLGVRFLINGETHYGWIRMTVTIYAFQVSARITGYAYDTVANEVIHAGDGFIKPQTAEVHPASLGALSLGADGLKLWRKQE